MSKNRKCIRKALKEWKYNSESIPESQNIGLGSTERERVI